jgi:DNA-binding transcriptional LysR family regulator
MAFETAPPVDDNGIRRKAFDETVRVAYIRAGDEAFDRRREFDHCIFLYWEFQRGKEVVPLAASGRLMVNDTGSLLGACLGGAGIAQLLEIYAKDLLPEKRLVYLLPEWSDETFPLYAYHHSSNLVSAKVRAYLDFVRELAGSPPERHTYSTILASHITSKQ